MGKLICLYGINNLGKSTQANLLVANLRELGKKAEYLKYPIYDLKPTGPFIHKVLRDKDFQMKNAVAKQLVYAANRFEFEDELEELLEKNDFVVAEDYVGTSIAWGMAEGADEKYLEQVNNPLLSPDLEILIDGERFTEAVEKNHAHETNKALTSKAREAHLELADKHGWKKVNANQTVEKVRMDIFNFVKELF